jgi:hypothetical protein
MRLLRSSFVAFALALGGIAALTPAAGAAPGQSLAFVVQPAKTVINHVITGTDLNPSGPPIQVEILNSDGTVNTGSADLVSIALAPNPANGTLAGTTSVHAVHGVATFKNLTINNAGIGYMLVASTVEAGSVASHAFDEVDAGTTCTGSTPCTTTASTPVSSLTVTMPAGTTGTISAAFDVGTPLVCAGYTAQDPNWFSFLATSTANGKEVHYTVRPSAAGEGILNATQFCLGAPYAFQQRGGTPAPVGVLPDGSSGFIGLLPDCPVTPAGPCISLRFTKPDPASPTGFDVVLVAQFPAGLAGDPWGRS